jgi:hypothetical protein
MDRGKQKVDRYNYEWETNRAKDYVADLRARLSAYTLDLDRTIRQVQGECKFCFYVHNSRIGGAACTSGICGLCDEKVHSGNTCLDKLCLRCAKERGLCKHCGGDLEGKNRRKVDFSQRSN